VPSPSARSGPVDRGWFSTIDHTDHLITSRPVRWGMGDALLGLVLAQVAAFVGLILVIAIGRGTDDAAAFVDDLSLGTLVVLQAFLWVGYCGWALVASVTRGNGPVLDYGWRFSWHDVYQGLLVGVGAQLVAVPVIYLVLFQFIGERDVSEAARGLTDMAAGPLDVVLLVLIVAVGAPVIEELFFRGLLLRSIERRFGSRTAVIVSSVIFAAIHFQALQFPALFMFGLLAAWLTVRSGRLGPAIWAHVGFNAVTVAVLLAMS
jgi:uncharacterized protein